VQHTWQVQEAKNRFSQMLDNVLTDGPQVITRRGVEVAILLSYTDYQRLAAPKQKLSAFFAASPLAGVELDLNRDRSPIREGFTP
jgi:prevent-host-death family protein